MKEVPLFNFEGKIYDLNFVDNEVQYYVVKDLISGVMVSQLIPAANDYVATLGFKDFCKKRSDEKDCNIYQLIRVASFDVNECVFIEIEKKVLFRSTDDLEKFLSEARDFLAAQEEE